MFEYEQGVAECIWGNGQGPSEVKHWLKSNYEGWPCAPDEEADDYITDKSDTSVDSEEEVDDYLSDSNNTLDMEEARKTQCTVKCIELCVKYLTKNLGHLNGLSLPSAQYILQSLPEYFHSHFLPGMMAERPTIELRRWSSSTVKLLVCGLGGNAC